MVGECEVYKCGRDRQQREVAFVAMRCVIYAWCKLHVMNTAGLSHLGTIGRDRKSKRKMRYRYLSLSHRHVPHHLLMHS